MKGRIFGPVALVATCAVFLASSGPSNGAGSCTLAPQLANVMVSQGLGGYTNLVHGRDRCERRTHERRLHPDRQRDPERQERNHGGDADADSLGVKPGNARADLSADESRRGLAGSAERSV